MATQHPLDRHDPRRNDALGLVRRRVATGKFTKAEVAKWRKELGDVVDSIVPAPPEAKSSDSKKE